MVSASPLGRRQGSGSPVTSHTGSPGWTNEQALPGKRTSCPYPFPLAQAHFRLGFSESGLASVGQISARVLAIRGCWRAYHTTSCKRREYTNQLSGEKFRGVPTSRRSLQFHRGNARGRARSLQPSCIFPSAEKTHRPWGGAPRDLPFLIRRFVEERFPMVGSPYPRGSRSSCRPGHPLRPVA
jgi:hypothetical protein